MRIEDIKVGMHVIPISSTYKVAANGDWHARTSDTLDVATNSKGYTIVCEISKNDDGNWKIRCGPRGRMKAWGNSNEYWWYTYTPEDLLPEKGMENELYFWRKQRENAQK